MNDILIRNYDHFWMQIDLDQLDKLQLEKWDRICAKLLTLEVNTTVQLRLPAWFPAAIKAAEEAVEHAIEDEEKMWTDTKGLRFGQLEAANRANKQLQQRTRAARAKVKKLKARYDVFKQRTKYEED